MPGPRAEVVIDGDVGPLRKMLREGVSAMNQFNKDSTEQLGGITKPLEGIAGKFSALVAVIGSGAIFKEAIDETVKFNKEAASLARTLGVSASEGAAWNVALGDMYLESSDLVSAAQKLSRILADDESKLTKLGIATRDANGHLKSQGDLFLSVAEHMNKFAEGTDRNIEGAKVWSKSWGEVAPLMKLTQDRIDQAREKAQELGLTLTEESTGRVAAYRASMNDVGDVMLGFKNAIGQAVMPALTRMGEWFASIGPGAITIVRGAIGGLATAFMGLQNGVVLVWETIKTFIYTVTEPIRSLGEALFKLMHGDFKVASEAMMTWTDRVGQRWSDTMTVMADESRRTAKDISDLWGQGTAVKAPSGGATSAAGTGAKSNKAAPSQMPGLEAMLAAEKALLVETGILRQYEAQDELAFWKLKLQMVNLSAEDRLKVERKVAQLRYEVMRQGLEKERELDALDRSQADALALSKIDTQRAAAKTLLDTDQITKQQFLQLEQTFENQRYEIQAQALRDRLDLLAQDPQMNLAEASRIKAQLLEMEQQYQRTRIGLMGDKGGASPLGNITGDLGTTFGATLDGLFSRTQTWAQSISNLFKGVRDSFIKNLITEPLGKYVAGLAQMLAAKLGFIGQETAAQAVGSATTMGIKATETTGVVAANAAQAGAGAAASQASIPYVGPILALAAMAAVFAAVSGLGSRKSAAGGFDIPTGMNPMTQLHEEEMVLPRTLANPLRDLIAGGFQGGGGEGGGVVHYYDQSGRLSDAEIERKARKIADTLNRTHRNGWRPGR